MSIVTKPVILDDTGKGIRDALDSASAAILAAITNGYNEDMTLQEVVDARDGFQSLGQNIKHKPYYFDTIEDLKLANLKDGDMVETLGMYSINDGDGAKYLITSTYSKGSIQLDNGLYASILNNFENNFYDEVTFKKERYYETDCYVVDVPLNDKDSNQINLIVERKNYTNQTPLKHAQDNATTLTINCGLGILNDDNEFVGGIVIGDGVVLADTSQYGASYVPDNYLYIGIKEDRSIQDFKINATTLQQLQEAGCVNVFGAYFKLINNYQAVDLTGVMVNGEDIVTTKHPRQVFCEMQDGSAKIFTCDGRTYINQGLTASEMQTILIEKGVKNAWNLDGGGSASTSYKTFKINRNIDDRGRVDRGISYTLNVKKHNKNKNVSNVYSFISQLFYLFNARSVDEKVYEHNISGKDLNNLIGQLYFGMGTNLSNSPTNYTGGYFINMTNNIAYDSLFLYNKQIFIPLNSPKIFMREQYNGNWNTWTEINSISNVICNATTLSETAAYEEITLSSVNNLEGNNLVKNDDNTFSFTNVKNRMFYLTCRIKNSSGLKFIKIQRNGTDLIAQSNYNSDTHEHELSLIGNLIVTATSDKFKILAYGNSGDVIERINITIQ